MIKNKERIQSILEILFLLVLGLTPLLWFHDKQVVVGLDSGYGVDYILYFIQRFYTWLGSQNLGVDMSVEVAVMPLTGLPALIKFLGVSTYSVQKILFSGWFSLILLSMYAFTKYIFPESRSWVIRLVAPIIYAFNLHIYSFWLQGEQPILSSYVLLPLITLYVLKFVRNKISPIKAAIILNLIYLLFGSGGIRGFPLVGPAILVSFLFVVYYFILSPKNERKSYIKRLILLLVCSVVILFFTNAYYLLPFFLSRSSQFNAQVNMVGGLEGTIAWLNMVSTHAHVLNIFRLHGDNNWYDKPYLWADQYLKNPLLIITSFLFPTLAFSAILFARKKKEFSLILILTASALAALFFSAGSNSPLGFLYVGMMKFIPGFAAFRSAYYKFIPAVNFSYAVLIGFSIYHIGRWLGTRRATVLFFSCIAGLLLYHYPFFDNRNFVFNKPFRSMMEIPSYVTDFATWRNAMNDDYRTLIVPHSNRNFPLKTYTWGYWGSYPIFPLISDKTFVQFDPFLFNASENTLVDTLYRLLRKKDFQAFMHAAKITHIRYILLTRDIASDYVLAPTEQPILYEALLSNPNFRRVWSKGEWALYEIVGSGYYPKIHATTRVSVHESDMNTVTNMFEQGNGEFLLRNQQIKGNTAYEDHVDTISTSVRCISCSIREMLENPVIPSPSVFPGSLLYKYKLSRDVRLVRDFGNGEGKLGTFLGMSAKRTGEVMKLFDMQIVTPVDMDWILALNELEKNWLDLEQEAAKALESNDYDTIYLVYRYGSVQKSIMQKVFTAAYMAREKDLISKVERALAVIDRMTTKVEAKLSTYEWDRTFVYEIDHDKDVSGQDASVFVERWSLPKSDDGSIMLPKYQVDDGATHSAVLTGGAIELTKVPETAKRIRIFFDRVTNVLSNAVETKLDIAGTTKNCLSGSIENYSWDETYVLRALSLTDQAPKYVYVKRHHTAFPTQDFPEVEMTYFQPDLTLSPSNEAGVEYVYEYKGQQNDTGVTVYYCTDAAFSPSNVFGDISVAEKFIPQMYAVRKSDITQGATPQITYKQVNPTHYTISVKNATAPYILSFLEGFSWNWILALDGKEISEHVILNGYANGWHIEKLGDYTLELYFYTQRVMIIGIAITLVSVLLCAVYVVVVKTNRRL